MPDAISLQQLCFFVILLAAFGLLITERIRNDLVALLIILALALTGILKPVEALAGFGSEPAIVVASIFVMSAAFHQTRLDEMIGRWIARAAGSSLSRATVVIMFAVAACSAFTHHVTTTAVMLPAVLTLAREKGLPASKLLMPLSFAASLGTTITIIGAPAFLIASDVLQRAGRPGLGVFSIAPIGLSLSLIGIVFMVLVGRFLLPTHAGEDDVASRFRLEQYFTELTVSADSPFGGKTLAEIKVSGHYHFTVVGWKRAGQRILTPFANIRVQVGDVLLVNATPEDLAAFGQERGLELHPVSKYGVGASGKANASEDNYGQMVQAVIAPAAEIIGRTLCELDFRRRYGPIVVGLWRQHGFLQEELAQIPLRAGDVLVLQGDDEALARVERDPAFLLLMPFHGELRLRRKAPLVALVMVVAIVVAAMNWASLDIVMLAGAVAMVFLGCITPRQAYRAIDGRIYLFIAGAIPLGAAMQRTGTAELMATWLQYAVAGWNETVILLIIFAVVAVITQFMSDAGTTALFAPVALSLAQVLGHAPEPYVVTVAMAAVAAFLTPIGHHGNLLIYGPGRYQFRDFLVVGAPLTLLIGVTVCTLVQAIWPN
jgi:di/tricarboxylate transporter